MTNNGDAPTSIVATGSLSAASIDGDTLVTFSSGAGYWNSATGIVKTSNASNGVVVNYGGRGAVWVQPGQTISVSGATKIEYCYWYY